MSDLVAFLLTCIAEEAANAVALAKDGDIDGEGTILVQIGDVERRLVELHGQGAHACPGRPENAMPRDGSSYVGCDTLRLLALDHQDDPRFRPDWLMNRPGA
jgi:hypothetical protein